MSLSCHCVNTTGRGRFDLSPGSFHDFINGSVMAQEEFPLSEVPGISDNVVQRLQKRWITTAGELVSLGARSENLRALAAELGLSERDVAQIVDAAKSLFSSERVARLQRPVDTSKYPLGLERPQDQGEN
jgi:hypothetical protein